jgi:hypothetical protein
MFKVEGTAQILTFSKDSKGKRDSVKYIATVIKLNFRPRV